MKEATMKEEEAAAVKEEEDVKEKAVKSKLQ
jgi:hypothetical protein